MLIATLVISGLGIGLGLMLGVAARAFAVEENPLTKQVEQMMPGSQCGQCKQGFFHSKCSNSVVR